ncbi:MAG TPA: hypothetical protein P5205_06030 [Candidatus Paceibacterota bacterium]|nr:hypothetical protein [Verrucomicrobiota bacterium]HSA09912.1 hypothetical protein [Candidatus Paceibacterota bacterium]
MPVEARAWLNCWLQHKQAKPCALGVLLDAGVAGQRGENPVLGFMQEIAVAAGADLFYGFSEAPASELDAVMDEINRRVHQSSTVLDDMFKRAEPHRWWGDQRVTAPRCQVVGMQKCGYCRGSDR